MSEYPVEDFFSTCGHYEQARMGDKGQYICSACDEEQQLFQALKNAARKRLPSEKPQDGDWVLVVIGEGLDLAQYDKRRWEIRGHRFTSREIDGWFPIKHLLEAGGADRE